MADYEDDYYDFWADYEAELEDVDNFEKYETARINFSKFGVRSDSEEEARVEIEAEQKVAQRWPNQELQVSVLSRKNAGLLSSVSGTSRQKRTL